MGPSWEEPAKPCCARCDLGEGFPPLLADPPALLGLPCPNPFDGDGEASLLLSILLDLRCIT